MPAERKKKRCGFAIDCDTPKGLQSSSIGSVTKLSTAEMMEAIKTALDRGQHPSFLLRSLRMP
jgi:hypothetical protein